jgi:5S rRNA maturation endonuclease (ribonuclease M5)
MRWSQQQLNHISEELINNITAFYDHFGIEYKELHKMLRSVCFIHGGDNKTALNLYHKADRVYHYKCRTHGCEQIFGKSVIGMVRGLLSHRKYGWTEKGDEEVSFPEAVKFIINFLSGKVDLNQQIETNYENKNSFNHLVSHICEEQLPFQDITRMDIRKRLSIPSQYFMKRGFSRNILDEYDVGECRNRDSEMKYRAVVPIYNVNYKYIGATGRSVYEQCQQCKGYHHPKSKCMKISKWRHSSGLNRNLCLYNLHKAKQYIKRSNVAVIVESPGNVWRLEEAGIHNSVACFGTEIHDTQRYLLDENGAMVLIIIMDNDDAGRKVKENIKERFSKLYGLYFPIISMNDVAEMSVDDVKETLKPFIDDIMRVHI